MRGQLLGTVAIAGLLLISLEGCGSNEVADGLFAASSGGAFQDAAADVSGGGKQDASGGTAGSGGGNAGTGGTAGASGTFPGGAGGGAAGTSGTGATGGSPAPLGDIPCPTSNPFETPQCSVPGQVCCLSFDDPYFGECIPAVEGPGCETHMACAGPEDCPPGNECCGTLLDVGTTNRYERVDCRPTCDGPADIIFCDPYDAYATCPYGTSCESSSILPIGYYVCRN